VTFRSIGDIAADIIGNLASGEQWRPAVGHPGYEVSNHGRVRSLDRVLTLRGRDGEDIYRRHRGRVLAPCANASGHMVVTLGRGNSVYVHQLVLTAFVGPAPAGEEGCHDDGDASNNRLTNLRWGTRASNVADSVRHGTHNFLKENRYV